MATGFEQARSVVAAIAGDLAAADRVELELPETGVCSADPGPASAATGCCGPAAEAKVSLPKPSCAAPKPAPAARCCG
jgi:hypothetical protein